MIRLNLNPGALRPICLSRIGRIALRRRVRALMAAFCLTLGAMTAMGPSMVEAASLPSESLDFAGAEVVDDEATRMGQETRVITSAVSEVGERLRYSEALVVPAEGRRRLLEIPAEASVNQVFEHYEESLQVRSGQILFRCQGRACGRSTVWANKVYGESALYGRDGDQAYIVGAWRDEQNQLQLLSAYIVRRGNRTISVLEQRLSPPESYELPGANPQERHVLGPFLVPYEMGQVPRLNLDAGTAADVTEVAQRYPEAVVYLTGFAPASAGGPEAAMEHSRLALEAAGRLLEGRGISAERQVPIVVGAAIPMADPSRRGPRVEITLVRKEVSSDE